MRQEHQPYWLRKFRDWLALQFTRIHLYPQFDAVGPGCHVMRPRHVHVHGPNITMGSYVHIRATPSQKVWLTTWRHPEREGRIHIGDYSLISPGVRISSSNSVNLGQSVMLASYAHISDSDWHDTYDRTRELAKHGAICIGDNVWIGDGATVCKGVTIGENSIIGTRSVVTGNIPANVIAAGYPARIVRELDPEHPIRTRAALFEDPQTLADEIDSLYRYLLRGNSIWGWLKTSLFPGRDD